jgi:lipoprotein-releasing system ATP-binding protein
VVDASAADIVLEAQGIVKVFNTGDDALKILQGVDLTLRSGEMMAITGPSGVGKSTLLHILGALDMPNGGYLKVGGVDVLAMQEDELARFRNQHIGFVFQFHHLLPEFTALENVMMPAMIAGSTPDQVEAEALDLLRLVGLQERRHHRPGELSGGECQRTAMVRALIRKPLIVLADEPSGNLDEANSLRLHGIIQDLAQQYGQAYIVMTHDKDLAARMDRAGRLEEGRLHLDELSGS